MSRFESDSATFSEKPAAYDPSAVAGDMLASGFTKPAVIDALVSGGIDQESARRMVTAHLNAKFRADLANGTQVRQSKSWAWMGFGVGIMGVGLAFLGQYTIREGDLHANSHLLVKWWKIMTAGLFVFLYGFSKRPRPSSERDR